MMNIITEELKELERRYDYWLNEYDEGNPRSEDFLKEIGSNIRLLKRIIENYNIKGSDDDESKNS